MRIWIASIFWLLGLGACPILLAQAASKGGNPSSKKAPPKRGTEFEFEGSNIKGEKGTPVGSILEQASPDQTYDFVKVRRNWRKEMIKSADSLDTQGNALNLKDD